MRDISSKLNGIDKLSAPDFNALQNELENAVLTAGGTLDPGEPGGSDSNLYMLAESISAYAAVTSQMTDTGVANAYVLDVSASGFKPFTAYFDGLKVTFKATNSNTAASTVNINSLGVKSITRPDGSALLAGDIKNGSYVNLIYNLAGDRFEMFSDIFPNDILEVQMVNTQYNLAMRNMFYNPGMYFGSFSLVGVARWGYYSNGASVSGGRFALAPSTNVFYSLRLTGATSVTNAFIYQRLTSNDIAQARTVVTFSFWIYNETGAAFTPNILLGTPDAVDNFTTVTNRLTHALSSCPDASWTKLTHTVDISGYTNIGNGLEFSVEFPSGTLDSIAKKIYFTEAQFEIGPVPTKYSSYNYVIEAGRCAFFERAFVPLNVIGTAITTTRSQFEFTIDTFRLGTPAATVSMQGPFKVGIAGGATLGSGTFVSGSISGGNVIVLVDHPATTLHIPTVMLPPDAPFFDPILLIDAEL